MRTIILDTKAPRCYGGALFYKRKMGVMVFVNEIVMEKHTPGVSLIKIVVQKNWTQKPHIEAKGHCFIKGIRA
jgi:hypothetical protein